MEGTTSGGIGQLASQARWTQLNSAAINGSLRTPMFGVEIRCNADIGVVPLTDRCTCTAWPTSTPLSDGVRPDPGPGPGGCWIGPSCCAEGGGPRWKLSDGGH